MQRFPKHKCQTSIYKGLVRKDPSRHQAARKPLKWPSRDQADDVAAEGSALIGITILFNTFIRNAGTSVLPSFKKNYLRHAATE